MRGRTFNLVAILGLLALLCALVPAGVAADPAQASNEGFETGDLTGWTREPPVVQEDYVQVVAGDTFPGSSGDIEVGARYGDYMARLGTPGIFQYAGQNAISREFLASDQPFRFSYNLCSYDAAPYDQFSYRVVDAVSGTEVVGYATTAPAGKSPGELLCQDWEDVELDLSAYQGSLLRFVVAAGGTRDTANPTWAYVDAPEVTTIEEVTATVAVAPSTLNLASQGSGNSFTTYVELPAEFDVGMVDVSTVALAVNGATVATSGEPASVGDYDANGIPDITLKFSRQAVIDALGEVSGEVTVGISGNLTTGSAFSGSAALRVIGGDKAVVSGNGKKK